MTESQLKRIMHNHLICTKEEAEEAINFVYDLIYESKVYTENNEPYAINSIKRMEETLSLLDDSLLYINE